MLLLFRWLLHRHKASICHLGCFTEDIRAALAPEPSSVLLLGDAMSCRPSVPASLAGWALPAHRQGPAYTSG